MLRSHPQGWKPHSLKAFLHDSLPKGGQRRSTIPFTQLGHGCLARSSSPPPPPWCAGCSLPPCGAGCRSASLKAPGPGSAPAASAQLQAVILSQSQVCQAATRPSHLLPRTGQVWGETEQNTNPALMPAGTGGKLTLYRICGKKWDPHGNSHSSCCLICCKPYLGQTEAGAISFPAQLKCVSLLFIHWAAVPWEINLPTSRSSGITCSSRAGNGHLQSRALEFRGMA